LSYSEDQVRVKEKVRIESCIDIRLLVRKGGMGTRFSVGTTDHVAGKWGGKSRSAEKNKRSESEPGKMKGNRPLGKEGTPTGKKVRMGEVKSGIAGTAEWGL